MALPRPALIAILGGVLILAAFAATRVAGQAGEADGAAGPVEAPPPAQPVKSGRLSLRVEIEESGGDGSAKIEFGGPFQSRGAEAVPAFDFELSASGDGESFSVGAVSTGDRGWLSFDGKASELSGEEWQAAAELRREAARLGAAAGGDQAAPLLDTSKLLVDERTVGTETIDGVETVHTSGRVDVARLFGELDGLIESQAALTDLDSEAAEAADTVARAMGEVEAETYVGRDDGILRRLQLRTDFKVPPEVREELEGASAVKVDVTLELHAVNEQQTIEAPTELAAPGSVGLEGVVGFGIATGAVLAIDPPPGSNSIDPAALSGQSGSPSAPSGAAAGAGKGVSKVKAGDGLPKRVAGPLSRGRVVVLLFTQGGADDDAVKRALDSLRGVRNVSVVADDVRDLGDYSRVVGELDIDRAPAVVVVGKEAKAQVVEGYVDGGSLRQLVEDAR